MTGEEDRVVVRVSDDGIGGGDPDGGSGLCGPGDRVATLDGSLEVEPPAGGGTTVHALIPVPPGHGSLHGTDARRGRAPARRRAG